MLLSSLRKLPLLNRTPPSAVCDVLMVAFPHKTSKEMPSQISQLDWCPGSGHLRFSHLGSKPLRGSREEVCVLTRARFTWNQGSEAEAAPSLQGAARDEENRSGKRCSQAAPSAWVCSPSAEPRRPRLILGWGGGGNGRRRPSPGRLTGGPHAVLRPRFQLLAIHFPVKISLRNQMHI